jgi:hypothetical protein
MSVVMLRRTVDVKLTNENTCQLESILREVGDFFIGKRAAPVKIPYYQRLSYNELCLS